MQIKFKSVRCWLTGTFLCVKVSRIWDFRLAGKPKFVPTNTFLILGNIAVNGSISQKCESK